MKLRKRQVRNLLATLFLSQGVPMLVAGDEIGRTQGGNNNAYCQDNEISWLDWHGADQELLTFCRKLIRLRKEHPVFRRRTWFLGEPVIETGLDDICWLLPDGKEMEPHNWKQDFAKSLGVFLNGHGIKERDPQGKRIIDHNFYLIFNAHHESITFTLPGIKYGKSWLKVLDTADLKHEDQALSYQHEEQILLVGKSVMVLSSIF